MFRFAQPEYLYLLIIVPILWGLFIYGRYRSRRNLAKYGNPSVLAPLMTDVSKYKPWINRKETRSRNYDSARRLQFDDGEGYSA